MGPGEGEGEKDEGEATAPPNSPTASGRGESSKADGGESTAADSVKQSSLAIKRSKSQSQRLSPEDELEFKVIEKLKEFVNKEQAINETDKIAVAVVWRPMKITRLKTLYPNETVPPPPIPPTPMPEIAPEDEHVRFHLTE